MKTARLKTKYYIGVFVLLISCTENRVKEQGNSIFDLSEGKALVFKNVNLFDGENYLQDVNVIISDKIILKITKEEKWPDDAYEIEAEGKTILPPLFNAHVHVWSEKHLLQAQQAGVFALFDMHTTDEAANFLRGFRDSINYAYYYSSGPGATVPGGHGTQYGVEVPTINDQVSPDKFVEERVRNGADYIKILREPYFTTVSFEQTKEIIDAAHLYSKLCVAHISTLRDAMTLNTQGVDGFVHIWSDEKINDEQLDSLASNKIFIVPTLYVIMKLLAQTGLYNKFDEVLEDTYKVYSKGIPILAGTDAPNFNLNYGDDLFKEMELLSKSGIPNIEVLKAATSNIYNAFGLKESGMIRDRSAASFIVIDGDPLKNISDLNKIESIWKNGIKLR